MSQATLDDVDKMLDAYIYDYFLKRKLYASARSFLAEGEVFMDPVAFDAPGGFLLEWWSVFWDLFIARTNPQHSEAATSYIKSQLMKDEDFQQSTTPTPNRLVVNNSLSMQKRANKMSAKMDEENSKLPIQRDTLANVLRKKRSLKHESQPQASMFGTSAMNAQALSQSQTPGDNSTSSDSQYQSHQLPGSKKLKGEMKSIMKSRVSMEEGIAGSNPGTSQMTLKRWPSTHLVSSQHSQDSNHIIQQEDKLTSSGITNVDGNTSNNDQANNQADMNCLMDDGPLDDVESFLTPNESGDNAGLLSDSTKGLALMEICVIPASTRKVECCCFSSDGKLLASGGSDKKATVWCTKSFKLRSTLDEHSQWITDIRFSTRTLMIATSSGDGTVKVWDVDNHGQSLRTFTGHSTGVASLDFHPSKDDLICSSDSSSEIRYWSIKNGSCVGIFKGGATKLRFQPNNGRRLAAAVGNVASIIDIETQVCMLKLQGHKNQIHSICWDPSGEYLASTSDDITKVWKFGSGSKGECIKELNCNGNTFHTCVFHPTNTSVLIIGSHESLEVWDMTVNKTRTLHAHEKLVSALAASNVTGLVASASHDNCVKLWQ